MKLVIVIPAYNEAAVIFKVLKSLPKKIKGLGKIDVVVVDDGSRDDTYRLAQKARVNVARHGINRGVGAATKTGFMLAQRKKADIVVTLDADGQHDPDDLPKVIAPILQKKADVAIGTRFKKIQKSPLDRLILNWFANLTTFFLFGVFSTDSQSGFRAFSQKALNLIDIKSDRMEFSSEILVEAKRNNLKVAEVPIKAIYTPYSRKKGQKNTNAIPIMARFLVKLMR